MPNYTVDTSPLTADTTQSLFRFPGPPCHLTKNIQNDLGNIDFLFAYKVLAAPGLIPKPVRTGQPGLSPCS